MLITGGALPEIRDELFKPMDLPHKWSRISIDPGTAACPGDPTGLPVAELAAKVKEASAGLTAAAQLAIRQWADSNEGKLWCVRKNTLIRHLNTGVVEVPRAIADRSNQGDGASGYRSVMAG